MAAEQGGSCLGRSVMDRKTALQQIALLQNRFTSGLLSHSDARSGGYTPAPATPRSQPGGHTLVQACRKRSERSELRGPNDSQLLLFTCVPRTAVLIMSYLSGRNLSACCAPIGPYLQAWP
ncbi:unnamed protein product [Boreogadus saida]